MLRYTCQGGGQVLCRQLDSLTHLLWWLTWRVGFCSAVESGAYVRCSVSRCDLEVSCVSCLVHLVVVVGDDDRLAKG